MRAFAHAKEAYDAHARDKRKKKEPLPPSRFLELVKDIEFELAREDMGLEPEDE